MPDLFLGIDAGGTNCRARLVDAAGRLLGTGRAGPANLTSGIARAHRAILAASAEAFAAVTLAHGEIEALRKLVRVTPYSPDLPPPNDRPARASVRWRDGRVLVAECLSARGGSDRPLPPETVTDKLLQLAAPVYPAIVDTLAPLRALEPQALARGWRETVDAFTQPTG